MDGIEIAPTAIWPDINSIRMNDVSKIRKEISGHGLQVSGIQSLLFGHPEFQIFDRSTWLAMKCHLERMIEIAGNLETGIAVFGSPKNRVKGILKTETANAIAAEFFSMLIPTLEVNNVVLTLEPNAPEYGADYLMSYEDVTKLSNLIGSEFIGPQIDTGCLWMVGVEPISAISTKMPEHIHLSTPNMEVVPGLGDFDEFIKRVIVEKYKGWLVLEMLRNHEGTGDEWLDSVNWIVQLRDKLLKGF
jgi:D-psicose/D-tagatose/L-ribulose 3-epimerase